MPAELALALLAQAKAKALIKQQHEQLDNLYNIRKRNTKYQPVSGKTLSVKLRMGQNKVLKFLGLL